MQELEQRVVDPRHSPRVVGSISWIREYGYTCGMMKKLRFLVSLHTRENDFQMAQAKTAEATAHKLGSDVEIVFADNDAVNQSTQLLKAIQNRVESRPDAIIVEPFGGTALPQVARAACCRNRLGGPEPEAGLLVGSSQGSNCTHVCS